MKPWTPLTIAFVAGCSGPGKTAKLPTPAPDAAPPAVPAVFEPAALLRGDWTAATYGTTVTWMRPGRPDGAIYGVALSDPPAVWVVDDEPTDQPAAARWLRLSVYEPDAPAPRHCDHDRDQPEGLWFACGDDAGGTLRFVENGEMLDYEIATDTAGPFTFHHSPTEAAPAPDAAQADRDFAADTAARGADGWVAWFADDGVQFDADHRAVGPDQVRAAITPTLEGIALRWQPTASRLAPDGALATTAGTFEARPPGGGDVVVTGTYVTVWRKEPAGWRVIFDVGRSDAD